MEEKKVVAMKKDEFTLREHIKNYLGKGKLSRVRMEYTPVGEKIIISTSRPGLIIGRGGEKIEALTNLVKRKFKLENPHIEIDEIREPDFDAQTIADEIATNLERSGPLKFKVISYRTLQRVIKAGALGVEIRLSGKLPGARAKSWRFFQGYLKKVGESANIVDRAKATAQTKPGIVGVKVSILSPHVKLKDRIIIDEEFIKELKAQDEKLKNPVEKKIIKKKTVRKKKGK
jgi:small subunit ribosomal protein S3